MLEAVDLARLSLAVVVFSFAALSDWRTRRVPNHYWHFLWAPGVVLLVLQPPSFSEFVLIGALIGFFLWLYHTNVLGGGADAKAFICLAILFPSIAPVPFSLLVFVLAVLIGLGLSAKLHGWRNAMREKIPLLPPILLGIIIAEGLRLVL